VEDGSSNLPEDALNVSVRIGIEETKNKGGGVNKMPIEQTKPLEVKAPFNMAISTLESLRSLLDEITKIEGHPLLLDAEKQNLKIKLVKRFYCNSSPLLTEEIVSKYKAILEINPPEYTMTKNRVPTNSKTLRFDFALDIKLEQFLIDIQRELQKEKYFMPPKRDRGRAVAEF